jgi:effector-binding domain-containing protein
MTMTYAVELADLQQQSVALVRGRLPIDRIAQFLGAAFGEVMTTAQTQGLRITGAPFGRYRFTADGDLTVEAGFPVSPQVAPVGRVEAGTLPGGRVARTLHRGAYAQVRDAYAAVESFLTDNGYEPTGPAWESYLDGPDAATPRTEVYVPCRKLVPHRVAD